MDVGLLASEAWVAAWAEESETAKRLANLFGGFTVPLSSAAALALQSLGPALRNEAEFVGLLEVTDTKNLANFFLQISDCEHRGWEILEIRIRKSGPSGAHAFFAKLPNAQRVDSPNFAEIGLEGEYRKFF